jgi:hypothetical protein
LGYREVSRTSAACSGKVAMSRNCPNNTIQPTSSYDTIDIKTRPTSMARQHSLSCPIIHRGTSPIIMYCMSTTHACPMYPILYSEVPSLLGHEVRIYFPPLYLCLAYVSEFVFRSTFSLGHEVRIYLPPLYLSF